MTKAKIIRSIGRLLSKEKLGVLSVLDKTYPGNFLMAFSASKDNRQLYFATSRKTEKYSLICKRPFVSLMIDDRKNCAADFKNAKALTVVGKCLELQNSKRRAALKLLLKKHPVLKKFLLDDETVVMSLVVTKFIFVTSFQEVAEIRLS